MLTEKRLGLFIRITLVLILVGIGASGYLYYKNRIGLKNQEQPIIDQQISILEKRIAKQPGNFDLRILIAKRLFERDRIDEAKDHLDAALKIKKGSIAATYLLGLANKEQDNTTEAISWFNKAIKAGEKQQFGKINTYLRDANFYLAEIYEADKDYDKALKYYKTATEIGTADSDTIYKIGTIYAAKKDYKTAIDYYDKALQFVPNYKEALESFDEALEKLPKYAEGHYKLAKIYAFLTELYVNSSKNEEAKESSAKAKHHFQEVLDINANHKEAKQGLANLEKLKI